MFERMKDFTHFNEDGKAKMVDVGDKPVTERYAVAFGKVKVNPHTFSLIKSGGMKKGDVLTVAQVAGIMAAKKTWEIIPMCHPIEIQGVDLQFRMVEEETAIEITATVKCDGKTGVEMEAMTAVTTAALTIYDMCKAVQKDIEIQEIHLLKKTGGTHGDYKREAIVL